MANNEALFEAVKRNSTKNLKEIIKSGVLINSKMPNGGTPLHYAAWKCYDEIAKLLLENKANPNEVNKSGFTPLHYAAKFSHFHIVTVLLTNGAIYNFKASNDKTPFDLAVDKNIIAVLTLVDKCFNAVKTGDCEIINDLKKIKEVDTLKSVINAKSGEQKTLIATAVSHDFPKIKQLKQLLEKDLSDELSHLIDKAEELLAKEKLPECKKIYKQVLSKKIETLGADNSSTLTVHTRLAKIIYKEKQYEEALNCLNEIYDLEKAKWGENHPNTLSTRGGMALILHRQGHDEAALKIYKEIYEKQKETLGSYHEQFVQTQSHMAIVLEHLKMYDEALSINAEVLQKNNVMLGLADQISLVTQNNIAMILTKQGNHEKALELYTIVYDLRKLVLGATHSDTLRTLHNKISVLSSLGKYEEALQSYKELYDTQKSILGVDHFDTLNTQCNIGNLHLSHGNYVSAFKHFNEGLEKRSAYLGPNHPHILDTKQKLMAIHFKLTLQGKDTANIEQYLQRDINVAANDGEVGAVLHLLETGANVNDKDTDGRSSLHFAVNNGHVALVKVLLKNKADVESVTNKGNTALHTAATKGNRELVELLLKSVKKDNLGEFVNAKTVGGTTALHVAAMNDFLEIARVLLKNGAIYNVVNRKKKTALNLCKDKNVSTLLKLVEKLFEDVKLGNVDCIVKLRSVTPDELLVVTNARNRQGKTLLQLAKSCKHTDIANELVKMVKKPDEDNKL